MMTRYEVWLDNMSLSAIDPAIYIRDIAYDAPRSVITAADIPGRNGQRVTNRHAQSTSVTVTVEIHEQDIRRRQDICGRIQAWAAKGGMLTTNDRRGQRLRVECEVPPVITSVLKWTQVIKMMFAAYEQPFWEDKYARSVTMSGTNDSKSLYVPGFGAETRAEASVKNVSGGTVNALTIKAGGTTFEFESLALGNGETLEIGYDENGLLFMRAGEESKMHCRTAESDDDLMLETGKSSAVSVSADRNVDVTLYM